MLRQEDEFAYIFNIKIDGLNLWPIYEQTNHEIMQISYK